MTHIEYKLHGIPCLIDVLNYKRVEGSFSFNAPSDWDYYGYTEIDYELLDRKGYKASWLMRKMTKEDVEDVESTISRYFSRLRDEEFELT